MRITSISEQQFDNFAKNHIYNNYYQTSSYGKVMSALGFTIEYIGITDDVNQLLGASLIIYKSIFMGKKIAYAPRGILFNYDTDSSVQELASDLKNYFSKKGVLVLRMDPYIPATIRNSRGKATNMNKNINVIMANLKHAGFIYKGQNKFFENELSRYEGVLLFKNRTLKDVYIGFNKKTRHKINKAANSGINVISDHNIEPLIEFCKNNNITKYKDYYKMILDNFKEKATIYYTILNTTAFVTISKNIYEKEMDRNDFLSRKIQSISGINNSIKQRVLNTKIESDKLLNIYKEQLVEATNLLEKNPQNIILGSAITIEYNNEIYLVEDFFTNKLKNLNANYLTRWFIISESVKKGFKLLNMNAMVGIFDKKAPYHNLNENKLGFGCIPTEYIGEFELIIDGFNYKLYQSFSKDKNYKFKSDIK